MSKLLFGAGCSGALLAAVLIGGAVSSPAAAQTFDDADNAMVTIVVRVDGEAIAAGDVEAVRDAHNEIVRAARRLCDLNVAMRFSLRERHEARACAAEAVENAIQVAARPALSAYFASLEEDRRFAVNRGPIPATALAAIESVSPST